MLHGLEDAGFIERVDNPEDGRSRLVKLLPAGAEMAERIVDTLIATNQDLIGGILTEDECEELARVLRKLSGGLEAKMSEKDA